MSIINVGLAATLHMYTRELEKENHCYEEHCTRRRLVEHRPEGAPEELEVFEKHTKKIRHLK